MTDLNEIIKDMTKEYLQPKYPIYRITYIMAHYWKNEDDEMCCEMIKRSSIFEILPELKNDDWNPRRQQNNKGEMSKKCLDFYLDAMENERYIPKDDDERQFILDIKRLA